MISQSFFHRNEKTRQFAIVFSYDYLTKLSNQTSQLFFSVLNDFGELNEPYFIEKEKITEYRNILYNFYLCRLASMIGSNEFKLKQGFRL